MKFQDLDLDMIAGTDTADYVIADEGDAASWDALEAVFHFLLAQKRAGRLRLSACGQNRGVIGGVDHAVVVDIEMTMVPTSAVALQKPASSTAAPIFQMGKKTID